MNENNNYLNSYKLFKENRNLLLHINSNIINYINHYNYNTQYDKILFTTGIIEFNNVIINYYQSYISKRNIMKFSITERELLIYDFANNSYTLYIIILLLLNENFSDEQEMNITTKIIYRLINILKNTNMYNYDIFSFYNNDNNIGGSFLYQIYVNKINRWINILNNKNKDDINIYKRQFNNNILIYLLYNNNICDKEYIYKKYIYNFIIDKDISKSNSEIGILDFNNFSLKILKYNIIDIFNLLILFKMYTKYFYDLTSNIILINNLNLNINNCIINEIDDDINTLLEYERYLLITTNDNIKEKEEISKLLWNGFWIQNKNNLQIL